MQIRWKLHIRHFQTNSMHRNNSTLFFNLFCCVRFKASDTQHYSHSNTNESIKCCTHTHFSKSSLSVSWGETKDRRCVSDISPVKHYVWPGWWIPSLLWPTGLAPIYPLFIPPLHLYPNFVICLFGDASAPHRPLCARLQKAGTWESPHLCVWEPLVQLWMTHYHFFFFSKNEKPPCFVQCTIVAALCVGSFTLVKQRSSI